MSRRNPAVLGVWGDDGTRVVAAEAQWRNPPRWNRLAREAGERHRVFCASLADVFEDRPDLVAPRVRLFHLISDTPHLDWLLLTKRPQNIGLFCRHTVRSWSEAPPPNVWFGATAEDRTRLQERATELCALPGTIRFLSCEPLLEDISGDLLPWLGPGPGKINWVIAGGESNQGGARARSLDLNWIDAIVGACRQASVPVFVKQMGSRPLADGLGFRIHDRHGGDMTEWPDWMRVREVPTP